MVAFDDLPLAELLWIIAGVMLAVAVFAAWAEHRRGRRPNLDRPGLMPWNLIQILAIFAAVAAAVLAMRS